MKKKKYEKQQYFDYKWLWYMESRESYPLVVVEA